MLLYLELFLECAEFPRIRRKTRENSFAFSVLCFIIWVSKKCYLHDVEMYLSQDIEFMSKANGS